MPGERGLADLAYAVTYKPILSDGSFRREMLNEALGHGRPEVLNADQGVHIKTQAFALPSAAA